MENNPTEFNEYDGDDEYDNSDFETEDG